MTIDVVDPSGEAARWCLARYFEELAARFEEGFDLDASLEADPSVFGPPSGLFVVASVGDRWVGCGGFKRTGPGVAYIKRMWVDGSVRGQGLGRRLLAALETSAAETGCHTIQLETNRALPEAIRFYRRAGYVEVEPFNDEIYAHHWFEKRVG